MEFEEELSIAQQVYDLLAEIPASSRKRIMEIVVERLDEEYVQKRNDEIAARTS